MEIKFVLQSSLIILFVSLCLGTSLKFWSYGIRNLGLIFVPPVVMIGCVLLPAAVSYFIIFKLNKLLDDKSIKKIPIQFRLSLGINSFFVGIRAYPMFVGLISQYILGLKVENRVKWMFKAMSRKFYDYVIQIAKNFTSDRFNDGGRWNNAGRFKPS